MKLFEYQVKELFAKQGIEVPRSVSSKSPEESAEGARTLKGRVVVKSQVLQGGRGKAGLIKLAATPGEASDETRALMEGSHKVRRFLIEEAVSFTKELYLSVTADPVEGTGIIYFSPDGGVDIEELARTRPDRIFSEKVDITRGLLPFQARDLVYRSGMTGKEAGAVIKVVNQLFSLFMTYDAELVEINPLFITEEGAAVAGDGKLLIDDNSSFRQESFPLSRESFDSDMEFEAAQDGIPYLQFDGDISLMCAGAGLTTTVYDLINYEGGSVANYLEFGGPNYKRANRAMELCLRNTNAKVLLIVTFGTIARADVMADGIVEAIRELKPELPIVTCIRGTNEEEASETLKSAGLTPLRDTEEAVRKAVALCRSVRA